MCGTPSPALCSPAKFVATRATAKLDRLEAACPGLGRADGGAGRRACNAGSKDIKSAIAQLCFPARLSVPSQRSRVRHCRSCALLVLLSKFYPCTATRMTSIPDQVQRSTATFGLRYQTCISMCAGLNASISDSKRAMQARSAVLSRHRGTILTDPPAACLHNSHVLTLPDAGGTSTTC